MLKHTRFGSRTLALGALLALGAYGASVGPALADDTPPASGGQGHGSGRQHDPAWAQCKKQADDQKLERGDARREFMKTCIKDAHGSTNASS
ncbi:MAG TPA: PsiF family protein [Steroidobacteraceae bacterium]|jgi:hypothetical protein|nr:PsiF family protein [Steroidobacteraceae bacterium]